ncbi:MAG: hypothetical protein ACK53Y_15630 [bacterium]
MFACAFAEFQRELVKFRADVSNVRRALRWRHVRSTLPTEGHQCGSQRAIQRPRRKGRHACRLYAAIKGRVINTEAFIMRSITWLMYIQKSEY